MFVMLMESQLKGHEQLAIRPISPEIEDVFIQLMQAQES